MGQAVADAEKLIGEFEKMKPLPRDGRLAPYGLRITTKVLRRELENMKAATEPDPSKGG
jgi:hypothetical protein